jgi:hypothetical protein
MIGITQQPDGSWMSVVIDSLLKKSALSFFDGAQEANRWATKQLNAMRETQTAKDQAPA